MQSQTRASSDRAKRYRETHKHVLGVEDALNHMLNHCRQLVRSNVISLIDDNDKEALLSSDSLTCNILLDFYDLRMLMEELFSVYCPLDVPLTGEERDELVDSFYNWLMKNGKDLVEIHYDFDSAKIANAMMKVFGTTSLDKAPPRLLASGSSKMKSKSSRSFADPDSLITYENNFIVPFQQFRLWFSQASAAVFRYREACMIIPDSQSDHVHL
jgi:hypothetical protein